MLENIRDTKTPKEAWDIFATIFQMKNNTKVHLLKNRLLSIVQHNMSIAQYFHKNTVKFKS